MNLFKAINKYALPLALLIGGRALAVEETNGVPPVTARDFYNAGTKLLAGNKFAAAERMFLSALAGQDERGQPMTLFNLGHTRFADGAEILKKGPDAQKAAQQGQAALTTSEPVLRSAESALAENHLDRMINAYLAGRGSRRELREAEKAVRAAMENFGKTLTRWQRAADDFRGAAELNPADTNATHNAKLVEQDIARLVDSLQQMQQMAGQLGNQRQQLKDTLGKLKGKIPQENAPPGGGGEEEDEEDGGIQPDALAGQKENPSREGDQMEMPLSPDAAGQLLDGLSLNGSRRLSMSDTNTSQPKDKKNRTW